MSTKQGLYKRIKFVDIKNLEDDLISVESQFSDRIHDIKAVLQIRVSSMEIVSAEAVMNRVPWDVCRDFTGKMTELAGLKIVSGIRQQVEDIIGQEAGCAHVVDLVTESLKAAVQTCWQLRYQELVPNDRLEQYIKLINGRCFAYSNMHLESKC